MSSSEKSIFPSDFAPRKTKESDKYGKEYAKAIDSEWRRTEMDIRGGRRQKFIENNQYATGTQPIQKYIDQISDGDTSNLNLNFSPLSIIPKFVDVIVNDIYDRKYNVNVKALDPVAQSKRDKERQAQIRKVKNKGFMQEFLKANPKAEQFVELTEMDSIEEVDLYMELQYKMALEAAFEKGIDQILSSNDYDVIRKKTIRDLVVNGIAIQRRYFDPNSGISVRSVQPENFVHSYTQYNDMRDCTYMAEYKVMTISELRRISDLDEGSLKEIADRYAGKFNNPDTYAGNPSYNEFSGMVEYEYDPFQVTVLDFEFISTDPIVYEKKGNRYGTSTFTKKEDTYRPPAKSKYKREQTKKKIQNLYGGYWVVSTEYIFGYGLKSNMLRKNTELTKTRMSFCPYVMDINKMHYQSTVDRMRSFADQMQIAHLKIQQLSAKARPAGLLIDVDGLMDTGISGKGGAEMKPLELIAIYNQTGNLLYSSEGYGEIGQTQRPPMQELKNGLDFNALNSLILMYNTNLQMIRDVSGVNEARDGARVSGETAVGVQQQQLMASNNATKGIDLGWRKVTENTCEDICLALQDTLRYSDDFSKAYEEAIGEVAVDVIEASEGVRIHDFGIFIDVEPPKEDKMILERDIANSVANGEIRPEDAMMIRRINPKLAYQMLRVRRKRYQKEMMQMEQQKQMAAAQSNIQSAQAASQSEIQKIQAKTQSEMALEKMKFEQDMALQREKAMAMYQIEQLRAQTEYATSSMQLQQKYQMDIMKEDRKDFRTEKQATQQSKMIEQRKNEGSKPIDFEGNLPDFLTQ
jgi:hypothetical protein